MSFLVCNHLEEERVGCFTFIVFLMSCDCWYSVVLLPNAVGWYAVSNCAISYSYSFTYCDSISCDGIMQRQCLTNGFMQLASGLCSWQLQAVGATYYIVTVFLKENVTCALEWG